MWCWPGISQGLDLCADAQPRWRHLPKPQISVVWFRGREAQYLRHRSIAYRILQSPWGVGTLWHWHHANSRNVVPLQWSLMAHIWCIVTSWGGNYRCGLCGTDLNRQWKQPDKVLHSSVRLSEPQSGCAPVAQSPKKHKVLGRKRKKDEEHTQVLYGILMWCHEICWFAPYTDTDILYIYIYIYTFIHI